MAVNWTKEQLEAITARGGNLLVAAAAGSGKTAVLVERIIRMITDENNPVSIDRLLVLTFTDAAASEMRRKISDAIDKKLSEEPDSEWLREQSIRVGSACISTIHSFCSRILTNNVHLTDLPSEFSLIDDTENKVLQARALDAVLESYYSRIDKKSGFRELVHGWGGIKGDDTLRELVIKLHDFSRSLAYPKKWLHGAWSDGYSHIEKGGAFKDTVWAELLERKLYSSAVKIYDGLKIIWKIVEREVPSDHNYYAFYYDMMSGFCERFDKIRACSPSAEDLAQLIESLEIKTSPRKTILEDSLVKRINRIRDKYVKAEKKECEKLLSVTETDEIGRIARCAPVVRTLCNLVRQTERVHQRYKKEKNVIDFSDLEHGLLGLLVNGRGEETPLCIKLRDYYHEILLDEFQDTNILQFEIFSKLSKQSGNLFMVGDVKQCIYKFRNADPSIFMSLYKSYAKEDGGHLIRLFKNFRSRREVVDSVNYVFYSVMSERLGGVDYTEEEFLINGAVYEGGDCYDTEVIITDAAEAASSDSTLADFESSELEAMNAAQRIKDLVCRDRLCVTDKESGELREARYGDVTVLCRGSKECNLIEEALIKLGINTISDTGRQYLDSVEVNTVLSYLQIIDNPMQDIPLIAVMRSPMFRFSADELAKIRVCAKGRFYTALCVAAENDAKAADFLDILLDLRECAKYMGADELVWKICNELHYFSIVGAMPNGDLRRANLKLLLERCSDFEQGSLTGLFNFIKYIEMLKENNKDLAPAKELAAGSDAVRIMTMHKSKGLEFPVAVLFGTAKKFFLKDIQRSIIWDEKLGIGLDYIDTRQRVRFSSPIRKMLESELLNSLKSEEMRLLYVAMTRAKEKLIISTTITSVDNKWIDAEFDSSGALYPLLSDTVMRMRDWILCSLMNSPQAQELRSRAERDDIIPRIDSDAVFNISFAQNIFGEDETNESGEAAEAAFENTGDIAERLDYIYPYSELGRLPIKLSVSELKRRRMPEEDFGAGLLRAPVVLTQGDADFGAAERGTITHFVLQHIDITKTDTEGQILSQIEDMVARGMLTKQQGEAVRVDSIVGFFSSELGRRLKAAKRFEREFDFYMLVPPTEVDSDIKSDGADDVILQGIADCFFYEDDGIVLIDYKTDRVGSGGVLKRSELYRMQIDYYAKGLSEILEMPIKEKYLYFLNCSEAVAM